MYAIQPLQKLSPARFETIPVLKQLMAASNQLAELKGLAGSMPNPGILINTLGLQEAKDSSTIENIVTTHHDLFTSDHASSEYLTPEIKEVTRYRQALRVGYDAVNQHGLLTNRIILQIHNALELNQGGFRKIPGVAIKNQTTGRIVHTPPSPDQISRLMDDLQAFINDDQQFDADPLIKMALIHHQFESIHPFYDGNGRTGRIINVLYLTKSAKLNIPVLYLSRYILRTRADYYRLLEAVQTHDAWEDWVLYMLKAVEVVASESIHTIQAIRKLMNEFKHNLRNKYSFYSHDLLNNIFTHPYTRIDLLANDLKSIRRTATKYLDILAADGVLVKRKIRRTNYYINTRLYDILTGPSMLDHPTQM